ncbi:MAG: class I SAM-dependent methyltransferase [Gammaproteobacteria bacterium]|nr:class I SAM-dependent methyltransferase [Gammaproteobacteria bacterium]
MMLSRTRHQRLLEGLTGCHPLAAASDHFSLYRLAPPVGEDEWIIVHDFQAEQIDNDIGHYVAEELLPLLTAHPLVNDPRYTRSEQQLFEASVGDIVRSMDNDIRRAWHRFYDNTLTALQPDVWNQAARPKAAPAPFIREFSAIYTHARRLLNDLPSGSSRPFTMLDVATCFGFFPLFLAQRRTGPSEYLQDIVGWDMNPALVDLANDYARHRHCSHIHFELADIRETGQRTIAFDAVCAIHLLEHLESEHTAGALDNLWQLTRQRLIVAVPLEAVPDARFGHRQVFDLQRLHELGRQLHSPYEVFEDHGGWLVADRPHCQF